MTGVLPSSATLRDLRSRPKEAALFVRNALGVMDAERKKSAHPVRLRMGVTGTGQLPNYRIEDATGVTIVAIDGVNHQPWPAGSTVKDAATWSSVSMSREDVQAALAGFVNSKR